MVMFQKFLITIAIVLIVWYGFKWLDRRRKIRSKMGQVGVNLDDAVDDKMPIKEMIKCPKCGAYVPEDDRQNCC